MNIINLTTFEIPLDLEKLYLLYLQEIINFEQRKEDKLYEILIKDSFIQYLIFSEIIKEGYVKNLDSENIVEVVDIGSGLGIPSLPIILALKYFNFLGNFKFFIIEPNEKKFSFIRKVGEIFGLDFVLEKIDEKNFYSRYRKKFDFVFCRAVFQPPKIFDIFRKFSKNFSFWQYSSKYTQILSKYSNKILQNKLSIFRIYKYAILGKYYFTIIFKITQ